MLHTEQLSDFAYIINTGRKLHVSAHKLHHIHRRVYIIVPDIDELYSYCKLLIDTSIPYLVSTPYLSEDYIDAVYPLPVV